jgi:hypothetical protein
LSVGSSIRRDLARDAIVHMLVPMVMSSDCTKTDLISQLFYKVPGQTYYRCKGMCGSSMRSMSFDLEQNIEACTKHTLCLHRFEDCDCTVHGMKPVESATFYMFTHSAYYIDMH